jgi:hypothetical protein
MFVAIAFQLCFRISIREVQESQEGMELNGTRQLLACTDDINKLDEHVNIIHKNTESHSEASKKIGLEVKAEKTK